MRTLLLPLAALALLLGGCYYDNEEELYPGIGDCDTSNVSYANDVQPVLENSCYHCHDARNHEANINLEGYDQVLIYVNNGRLLGSIRWDSGYSPMPQDAGKLSRCRIAQIEAWIDGGAPDN